MPKINLALKTLVAIDDAIAADGGNTYRGWLGRVIPHIHDAYRSDESPFRSHMGASTIGNECARASWYSFRWATRERPEGRMLRLWNRGHLEEARFIAMLLTIGCEVIQQDEHGRQFRISEMGGHYGGSNDSQIDRLPDLPSTRVLGEYKTHNNKSFTKLAGKNWDDFVAAVREPTRPAVKFEGEGLRKGHPKHYIQMQQYMRKLKLSHGVYFAVNKDNDYLYIEIIELDPETADQYIDRAIKLIPMQEAPKRLNESPSWYQCKFCDHRMVCHSGAPPERNCRTCTYSEPDPDGKWYCNEPRVAVIAGHTRPELSKDRQLTGCGHWTKLRSL